MAGNYKEGTNATQRKEIFQSGIFLKVTTYKRKKFKYRWVKAVKAYRKS